MVRELQESLPCDAIALMCLAADSSTSCLISDGGTGEEEEDERDNISISSSDSSSLSFLLSNLKSHSADAASPSLCHRQHHQQQLPSPSPLMMARSRKKMSSTDATRPSDGMMTYDDDDPEKNRRRHRGFLLSETDALEDEFLQELQTLLGGTASAQHGPSSLHSTAVDHHPSARFGSNGGIRAAHDASHHRHHQGSLASPDEHSIVKDDGCRGGGGGGGGGLGGRRQARSAEMTHPSRSYGAVANESNAASLAASEGHHLQVLMGPATPSSSIEVASSLQAMLNQSDGDHHQ